MKKQLNRFISLNSAQHLPIYSHMKTNSSCSFFQIFGLQNRFVKQLFGLVHFRANHLPKAMTILKKNYQDFKELNNLKVLGNDAQLSGIMSGVIMSQILEINGKLDEGLVILTQLNKFIDELISDSQEIQDFSKNLLDKINYLLKSIIAQFHKINGDSEMYLIYLNAYQETDNTKLNNLKHYKLGREYQKQRDINKAIENFEQVKLDAGKDDKIVSQTLKKLSKIYDEDKNKPQKASLILDILERQTSSKKFDKTYCLSSKAGLYDKMGQKNKARDCFLKYLDIKEAIGCEEDHEFIWESRVLCDKGYRYYQKKDYVNSVMCYEKALYKVEPFINSDTYLKFIIMLNIIWVSFRDRQRFKKKEEKFVNLYLNYAFRREPSMTILLINDLIRIFQQMKLDKEIDSFYEEIFKIIGENEEDLKVLSNGFNALISYCYCLKKQNRKGLALGLFKKANWVFNKLVHERAVTESMRDQFYNLYPNGHADKKF